MQVTLTARHMDLTDGLRTHVDKSLEKVKGHFDRVIDADVILSVEKHRHIAEITLHANGLRIHSKDSSEDMYSSLDSVISKLERQISKHKSRIGRFQQRKTLIDREYMHQVFQLHEDKGGKEVETIGHHVIRHEKLSMHPLSISDAAMQMELGNDPFIVFLNEETQQVNVIYAREDRTFGLIEPQF